MFVSPDDSESATVVLLGLDPDREAEVRAGVALALADAEVLAPPSVAQTLALKTGRRTFVFIKAPAAVDLRALVDAKDLQAMRRWVVIVLDQGPGPGAAVEGDPMSGVVHLSRENVRREVVAGVLIGAGALAGSAAEVDLLRGDLRAIARRVGHEFRSGLGCVITNTDLLGEMLDGSDQVRPILEGIAEASTQIAELVNRISMVARASGEPRPLADFSAEAGFMVAWENIETFVRSARASLTKPDSWPDVRGVKTWCVLIWQCLLENAVRHGGARPRIEVTWDLREDAYRFNVRDFGPGVAPQAREHLFLPFNRLAEVDSARGLSLTLVERLVRLQRGDCGHEIPADGRGGALFYFTLPKAHGQARGLSAKNGETGNLND